MSESDRGTRALISSDQCIVDEERFFIRGCLEIPILNSSEVFVWGLWASVKEEVFNEISEAWEAQQQLDLLQLAACRSTQLGAGPPVMPHAA